MNWFRLGDKMGMIVQGWIRYNLWPGNRLMYPRSVMISLTYWCNSRCTMCNIWKIRPKSEFTFKDWQKFLKDEVFSEVRNLTITGGEPSMYPNYVATIKMIIDNLPKLRRMTINSNGFTPKLLVGYMEEIAAYCQQKNIKLAASVSVDGVGERHNQIRGIPKGFEKCMETIEGYRQLAKKYNFSVGVSGVLMKQNLDHYQELKQWFDDKNIDFNFQLVGFHDSYLNNKDTEAKVGIKKEEMKKLIEALEEIKNSKKRWSFGRYYWEDMLSLYQNGTSRTTPCSFLKDDFCFDSFGDVYYCFSTRPVGNVVREQRSVGEIYFDQINQEKRRNFPNTVCKKCNSGCNVYYATAWDFRRWLGYVLLGKLGKPIS